MGVDAHQFNARVREWHRQAAGSDPEVEHRRNRGSSKLQPGPEVVGIRELCIELGESAVRTSRIVTDDGGRDGWVYATASSAMWRALSMMAKPSPSSSSLIQSGGLVMIVCQRTKV